MWFYITPSATSAAQRKLLSISGLPLCFWMCLYREHSASSAERGLMQADWITHWEPTHDNVEVILFEGCFIERDDIGMMLQLKHEANLQE